MTTNLDDIVRDRIAKSGPMGIDVFMDIALSHPDHGYYMTRDPFGAAGDFTTAPEISQMFGEMIGVWIADAWTRLGRPPRVVLAECGPGRGTLMADILRTLRRMPELYDSAEVRLIETSPVLVSLQRKTLEGYAVSWDKSLAEMTAQSMPKPLILVANEFLDALPVRQCQFKDNVWQERVIKIDADGHLNFGCALPCANRPDLPDGMEGDIFEFSPIRREFVQELAGTLKNNTGAALLIDYGHDKPGFGDTLQAVRAHQYASVLENIGDADLTTHVDFADMRNAAQAAGAYTSPIVEQGIFLKRLGIEPRANVLKQSSRRDQARHVDSALQRLVAPGQMGRLFKVMALCHDRTIGQNLSGFM